MPLSMRRGSAQQHTVRRPHPIRINSNQEITFTNTGLVGRPALLNILKHPTEAIGRFALLKRRANGLARWDGTPISVIESGVA